MPPGAGGPEGPRHVRAIADEVHLDELLSEPSQRVVDTLAELEGDIIVLGVGGKMGPTLARMARRAADLNGGSQTRHRRLSLHQRGARGRASGTWRGDDQVRPARRGRSRQPAGRPECHLHGRPEVWFLRRRVAYLGDELSGAGGRVPPLRGQPYRRVLDRQRLRADRRRSWRVARDRRPAAGRRVHDELPGS